LSVSAHAQQSNRVPRIGYLPAFEPTTESTRSEAIRRALREHGYIEGQNIAFEYRYAEGKLDRFPELAAELVRLKVDIIVVAGGIRDDPGGQECDQDDSYRYGGAWGRSCRGRPGWKPWPSRGERHRHTTLSSQLARKRMELVTEGSHKPCR